ncbi:hypothetical protein ONZ45_g1718 [Pleurotus djamor]|nr:hypothetical protein ONZ45_g1718 [Pleurotus djamor]
MSVLNALRRSTTRTPFILRHGVRRHASTNRPPPTDEPIFPQAAFEQQTSFFSDLVKRVLKLSAFGAGALLATGYALFEGTHMWVEHVELPPQHNQDTVRWEWNVDSSNWLPTDPALGYRARHSLRAAWMALHWGNGHPVSVISDSSSQHGGLNVVNSNLASAHQFLNTAISIAEQRVIDGKLKPETLSALYALHASVLERMNDPLHASQQYTRAWATHSASGPFATYVAARLGDVTSRLGQASDALAWWTRAISLMQNSKGDGQSPEKPAIPASAPSSPMQQRVLSSVLVSLSAFYATSGRLKEAQSHEEQSIRFLQSIYNPTPPTTPSQALHHLYLLHRLSMLSIHLAEVLHAQKQPLTASLQRLKIAAESSEQILHSLTSLSQDVTVPHLVPSDVGISKLYDDTKALRRPAASLFRDTRQTAAEAWNLMGVLSESSDPRVALSYYERGLLCAGLSPANALEETIEPEWKTLHGNYVRLQERMQKVDSRM